jgi:hypothetical protein
MYADIRGIRVEDTCGVTSLREGASDQDHRRALAGASSTKETDLSARQHLFIANAYHNLSPHPEHLSIPGWL